MQANNWLLGVILATLVAFVSILIILLKSRSNNTDDASNKLVQMLQQLLHQQQINLLHEFERFQGGLSKQFQNQQENTHKQQVDNMKNLQETLRHGLEHTLTLLREEMRNLTLSTDNRLKEISGQVDKRLTEGFEKTTATFTDIIKRLALIDEAQKKITELSSNVVSLQEVLSDKRSRGAFGEVQLNALIRNVLPEQHFSLQHTFSSGKRADCVLFLPEPTGNIAIDAKFPLETFQQLTDIETPAANRKALEAQFRQDLKTHIQAIAEKYIIPNETADGAVMFIPAEAVFAEIHAHYPDIVQFSQQAKVWLVSPTTLMAILTTARAVIKDHATRNQIHIIQELLQALGKDFERFRKRMSNLARHVSQAHDDVNAVQISAEKITKRFDKIEQVELPYGQSTPTLEEV